MARVASQVFVCTKNYIFCASSSFLSTCEIVCEKIVQVLLINSHVPFFVLKILLWSSFFFHLEYELFDIVWNQSPKSRPIEISFNKLLLFPVRIREICKYLRAVLGDSSISLLNRQFRPGRNSFCRNIFKLENFLSF